MDAPIDERPSEAWFWIGFAYMTSVLSYAAYLFSDEVDAITARCVDYIFPSGDLQLSHDVLMQYTILAQNVLQYAVAAQIILTLSVVILLYCIRGLIASWLESSPLFITWRPTLVKPWFVAASGMLVSLIIVGTPIFFCLAYVITMHIAVSPPTG